MIAGLFKAVKAEISRLVFSPCLFLISSVLLRPQNLESRAKTQIAEHHEPKGQFSPIAPT
jgi:hypothetical protein